MYTIALAAAFGAGAILGAIFFGGLWLTTKKLTSSHQPLLLCFSSFLIRTGIVLSGFYLVADGHWERLVASSSGFLIARLLLVFTLRDDLKTTDCRKPGIHAGITP